MSKREKQSIYILGFAVFLWFANNIYFGWNAKPENAIEATFDFLVWVFLLLSFLWKSINNTTTNNSYNFIAKDGKIGFEPDK